MVKHLFSLGSQRIARPDAGRAIGELAFPKGGNRWTQLKAMLMGYFKALHKRPGLAQLWTEEESGSTGLLR